MLRSDLAVIGGGPAGLAAAIEAAKRGCRATVVEMNHRAGGQLVKQIHKFFGSRERGAGKRGFALAEELAEEARRVGVEFLLDWEVFNIDGEQLRIDASHSQLKAPPEHSLGGIPQLSLTGSCHCREIAAKSIILATGAEENAIPFEGWTLPGVMGAGAAQTMANVWRVRPGHRVLMVGAGNVGLIVTYQLLQAGVDVAAIVEAAPGIGGYSVHAAKVRRAGVPVLLRHTVVSASGEDRVDEAIICRLDEEGREVEGSRKPLGVDTICIATGMRPNIRAAALAGCRLTYSKVLGGWLPSHNKWLETSCRGIYVAGDAAGIGEASTAIEEGKLAGICAAEALGHGSLKESSERSEITTQLRLLRGGIAEKVRHAKEEVMGTSEIRGGGHG